MQTWTPAELHAELKQHPASIQLLDVREPWEYQLVHLPDTLLIPLGQLMASTGQLEQLDKNKPLAVICHHGVRSAHACYLLERSGFATINVAGGIDRWARELNPSMPLY